MLPYTLYKTIKSGLPLFVILPSLQIALFVLLPSFFTYAAECSPGTEGSCTPTAGCTAAFKTCQPDGMWGPCVDDPTSCGTPPSPGTNSGPPGGAPEPRNRCFDPVQGACIQEFASQGDCESACPTGQCVDAAYCVGTTGGPSGSPTGGPSGSPTGGPSGSPTGGPSGSTGGQFDNPIQSTTFADLVQKIANAITAIGIPFVAIFIVWAGFLFVTAQGDEKRLEQAKKMLQWALIGGAIVIGAYALSAAVVNFAKSL